MMYIQTRRRKSMFPFCSFLFNSSLFFSLHFPLNLNCQSNFNREKPTHSEDPNFGASSSSTPPHVEDDEGGDEQQKGNNYEVFLSFRGKDTRKGFSDYLYTSLVDAGIHVFKDDNELCVGEEIGPKLLRSITQSKIAIPIISEDYTASKWCLRELTHILKCMRNKGQIVLPIFYKVEPSKVRHLTGTLGNAINAHKKNLDEMMEWEKALKEVTSLKGLESEKINNGHEAKLVKTIVRKVMSELKRLFLLEVPKQLVGIDDRVECIMSSIDAKINVTRIIGIYGMGGIGKTTLAKVLYNKFFSHYEYRSFVANIRETAERDGIKCIQKQLISDINGDLCDVSNVDDGICILKSRFPNKKVLILLDDVDDNTHLNALVEDGSWFKAGSIVIITTRDKSILDKAKVTQEYQLNELLPDHSLVLFSRHAFRNDSPPHGYEVITGDIVFTTGGLPLALEVIGSFLCGKTKEAWEATSKKLKKVLHKKVRETLRISYDALDSDDQQIFLDIACFFIGSSKQHLTYMWDACDFFPGKGIEVLSLLSLIKIDKDGNLMMHDQLRDLGREIVRLENEKKCQKRSRLWEYEDAEDVLINDKGTNKIEAICLENWERSFTSQQFKKLTKLRFLRVRGANFTGDFQNLLPQLRYLHWMDCPLDFEAANFHLKKLLVLDLSWTCISEDWRGWDPLKQATELKVLNLSRCRYLRRTPDLSDFKSLEMLILEECLFLEEIHPSIMGIKNLVSLNVRRCRRLKELPAAVGRMEALKELLLDHTTCIREISISKGCLTKLEILDASSCELVAELPESISSLVSISQLYLSWIGIKKLPESIGSLKKLVSLDASYCVSLAYIPSSIGDLPYLSLLNLRSCQELAQLPDSIGSLVSLQCLFLSGCSSLREIPNSIGKLKSLSELHLKSTAIKELPKSMGSLEELKILDASYCTSLVHIPSSIGSLVSLQCLLLSGCHSLGEIPASIGKLASLTKLDLKSTAVVELPESIGNMQNLRMLDISGTPIIELLDDRGILAELQELRASGWKNLKGPPSNTDKLVSPNKLDSNKLQKLSELCSRVLALVLLKCPRTPLANNSAMDCQTANSENVLKRSRPFGISDVNDLPVVNILPITYNSQSQGQSSYSSDDLPRNVVITLNQGSLVKSMDFHPVHQILLLVGTITGDVTIWEVGSCARIAVRNFKVWDLGTCSTALRASLANDYTASVNRVMWSPNGILFGVAYSKHMVHIYSYHGGDDIRNHLEIEAHVGSVNDLSFSHPNKELRVVTCGEDRLIKVWDAMTGAMQQSFEGHEAPVYSVCPHHKDNIQFIFSAATDGKIKAWLYDNTESRAYYYAPGHSSTLMAYSADGTRLFSCGTNKGESYLVEWNESEGTVKRTYDGLGRRSGGFVHFDTTKNRYLAAGDEFMVKFWDVDNNNLLTSTDADGGLPASPCIKFNKEGILLAVSTSDNSIKILANADGIRLLSTVDNRPSDASRITPISLKKPPAITTFGSGNATAGASLGDRGASVAAMVGMNSESMANLKPIVGNESGDKIWELTEINEPSQCRSIRLPDNSTATRVSRLIYTNSGLAILALSSNVYKLWKCQKDDWNLTSRATTSVVPQLWKLHSGMLMINDTSDTDPDDGAPCFALSKNGSYLISASGGKISLFITMNFKTVTTRMPRPPASTYLQDNDIITIGMEDSSIQICSGQVDEVWTKLRGHQRIIKGFAFSTSIKVLVSSGADIQTMTTFMPPPPVPTFLALYPLDNNITAIGMEDSSIIIYNIQVDEVKTNLKGHQKRITGLAFSSLLNILVSSGADSQLCVWSTDGWEKQASKFLQMPSGQSAAPVADTCVQFHLDQINLLVVHETQIAIYEAPKLECLKQWVTLETSGPITHATYSCDGQSIYVSFENGSIGVLTASTLRFRCRINPAAYISLNPGLRVYPLVVAAHPSEPNQFALGLTDGSVYLLEPLESEGKWGTSSPVESGAGSCMTSGVTGSDRPQSLNWQHQLCKNPRPNPAMKTVFVDHTCGEAIGDRAPSSVTNCLMGAVPKAGAFPPLAAHAPFQPAAAALPTSLAGWMANPSPVPSPPASAGPIGLTVQNNAAILKRPRTPPTNNSAMDYQTADSECVLQRLRPFGISDEVGNLPVNILPVTHNSQSPGQSSYSSNDLPKNVVMTLNQGSPVKSMDFHPVQQIVLLVGTNMGDVMVWEVGNRARIALRDFKVWDLGTCSMALQASLAHDYTASVNRVMWSPSGTFFGVAFSKHMVHIYSYDGGYNIRNHLEIEAHIGSVNDLAFSYQNKQLCVVTCGEDRSIKVWDAVTGDKQHTFEGHEAPVYSICPHHKENIQFIFSTATDGKIKAWLDDNMGSRVLYDAPAHMMAYSADGTRLFSCGTNKEGESYLVEWNESEGAVKRTYQGLGKIFGGFVQFDTTKNRFLAAGDEFMVKFWDMDNNNILTSTDAEGGLPASPFIKFNREGILLAVSTSDNSIKILANSDGIRLLRTVEKQPFGASRVTSGPLVKPPEIAVFGSGNATVGASGGDGALVPAMVGMNSESMANVKPRIADESGDKSWIRKLTEINQPSQCRSIRLPANLISMRVLRLIYTNSGRTILALSLNAVHMLWKWQESDRNLTGKATTSVVPQLWRPSSGILMTNDITDTYPEDAVACFALSKNDCYVISASGGRISLFNMRTFKTMTTFMPPPVAATFLAFHPQDNNIIAIGMEDSSIQIYNVQVDEVKTKLKGHQKRITGLAFSNVLNVLVSSGADSQLCVWSTDGWEKQDSKVLQMSPGQGTAPLADTRVQFHLDQIHLLVVHKMQIAIYEAPILECLKQWVTQEASGPITHATYSCDGESIYVSFEDGSIGVLIASTLRFRCCINPAAYIPPNPRLRVYPLVITAHPFEPNQFAVGLTDGNVYVLEPLESEGKWGTSPPVENGAGPSTTSGAIASEQPQR